VSPARLAAIVTLLTVSSPLHAQQPAHDHSAHQAAPAQAQPAAPQPAQTPMPTGHEHMMQMPPAPAAPAAPAAQADAGAKLTLDEVERLALARNPTLVQAGAQVDAAKGRATQAGLLPNPTVGYAGEDLSAARSGAGALGDTVRGSHGFFVEQTIPLGGKLARGRDLFTREAQQADALVAAQRQRVLTAVRLAYRDAVIADRRVAVRDSLARLAAEAVTVSGQLFNVGAADRPDTLEADIEARRAALALVDAKNARVRVWRQLGALVGDPAFAPQPLAGTADDPLPALEHDEALGRLLRGSPELLAARAGVTRAEAGLGFARREQAPDLIVRAGSRYDRERIEPDLKPGGWGATVEAGVTLPIFNRNQGGVATATAGIARAKADNRRLELDLASRAAEAFEQYDTARQTVTLYRQEILPRAEEAYTLYRRNYEQMAGAYPQVLIAQRTLFQVTDQYLDAIARAWSAALRLDGFLLDAGLESPDRP
jgi:cobalt-zinc-cadmium efflux system outer membrane protein